MNEGKTILKSEEITDPNDSVKKNLVTILQRQSEFCKLFTNPTRLQILHALMEDTSGTKSAIELNVTEIQAKIKEEFDVDLNQTTLSQHLSLLRKNGAVETRRDGNNVYYKISNDKLMKTCGLVREIVLDLLKDHDRLSKDYY